MKKQKETKILNIMSLAMQLIQVQHMPLTSAVKQVKEALKEAKK